MASWNTTPLRSQVPQVALAPAFPFPPPHAPSPPPPSLLARVRGSTWLSIALRVGAVTIALFVLAWIGRTASAGPSSPPAVVTLERDGAAPASAQGEAAPDAGPAAPAPVAIAALPPAPPAGVAPPRATASEPVFINHAGVDELRRLPGVGAKRAEAILVLRQRLGRFQRVEDLLRVKGVGRGAVKKWRPLVRLDTPSAENAGDAGLR